MVVNNLLKHLRKLNKDAVKNGKHKARTIVTDTIWHKLVKMGSRNLNRKGEKRLIVILNSRGCSYAMIREGPCFNCGLVSASNHGYKISAKDIMRQFNKIINSYNFNDQKITELDLFNAGSLLDDWQISEKIRKLLFTKIASINTIKDILIDSRPEDITREKIITTKTFLGDKKLWVGIGLETANDIVRNLCINKHFSLRSFEAAVKILQELGVNLFVYLIFKPAFLTEYEAIKDAKNTIRYLSNLSKNLSIPLRISLEPGVLQGDCLLTRLYSKGFYKTPWLWSIIKILKETHRFTHGCLRVGIPEEVPKIIDKRHNYDKNSRICDCSPLIEKCILDFNQQKKINVFDFLPECDCQQIWKAFLIKEKNKSKVPLEERIVLITQSL